MLIENELKFLGEDNSKNTPMYFTTICMYVLL